MRIPMTLAALVLATPLSASAQDAPTPEPEATAAPEPTPETQPAPPAPEPSALPAPAAPVAATAPVVAGVTAAPAPTVSWEGLVDTHYLYNFTGDPSTQAPLFRQFDTNANSFTLNYAKLGLQADLDVVSARVDVGYGILGATAGVSSAGFVVQQAYGTARLGSVVCLDAGRFVTHAGAEVIETNKNWLYSRSLLFFGIPLYHTGARLNLALGPALKAMLSLVNGWNNDPDENAGKTAGANLTYAAHGITASATTYIGKEGAGASDYRLLLDGVFAIDLSPSLSLGANVDFLKQGDAHWFGVAAMGRAILTEGLALALRGEFLKDKNAYGIAEESLYEGTLMLGYTLARHFEIRAEVRADMSSAEVFDKGGTPRKNQVTGLLGFLAYF
ncbi:MAG: porin [Deltaproteobacteria bacterium]|nr:porin [Deltaproteobacteria bacterium]